MTQFPSVTVSLNVSENFLLVVPSAESSEAEKEYSLDGSIRFFDIDLSDKLDDSFEDLFTDNVGPSELQNIQRDSVTVPEDRKPIAIVFNNGELLLLWTQSVEFDEWVQRLQELAPIREKDDESVIIRTPENYFSATIYKHLVRED